MSMDLGGTAADAWAMWRRDRAVLVPLAGLLLFAPTLALLLFVAPAPVPPGAGRTDSEMALFIMNYRAWIGANGGFLIIAGMISALGGLGVTTFYLDRTSATVGDALARAVMLLPRYLLASALVLVPAFIGLLMLVVPGLYVLGRTLLVGPVLVAEQPISAVGAVGRALALSHRRGLVFAGIVTIAFVGQQMLPLPLLAIDEALHRMNAANPLVIAVVDAGAAALTTAVALGLLLFRISLYRRLA